MADKVLDLKGLGCPLPVLKTKKALGELSAGQTIEVLATDSGAPIDIEVLCRTTGNILVESTADGGVYRFLIRKS